MSEENSDNSMLEMLDMYIFETRQNIKQLEQIAIKSEELSNSCFTKNDIDEIFRLMHTIKGSSAMMQFDGIAALAHKMEDLFFFLRENLSINYNCSLISDLMLESVDLINNEITEINKGINGEFDAKELVFRINEILNNIKKGDTLNKEAKICDTQECSLVTDTAVSAVSVSSAISTENDSLNLYKVLISFEEDCQMENLRALGIVIQIKDKFYDLSYFPEDIENNTDTCEYIINKGFTLFFKSEMEKSEVEDIFSEPFIEKLSVSKLKNLPVYKNEKDIFIKETIPEIKKLETENNLIIKETLSDAQKAGHQGMMTVNVSKLDELMDMISELVISEAMVINNTDLKGLKLTSFNKAANQLHKITNELQKTIMSLRMVSLSDTFSKMNRIVRDMNKKLGKNVSLETVGADIEVDKNIVDHLSDPLMHLVRNAIDHGIEFPKDRVASGKPEKGIVLLEAKKDSGLIQIIIKDDGKGINKKKLLESAKKKGLLKKPENEMTDEEIFSLIFLPGFSTNQVVTEFSGRGVGMDVVLKDVEALEGRVSIASTEGIGTQFTLSFPVTLAIIEALNFRVGESIYTIPITAIKETFKPNSKNIVTGALNKEMVLFRGQCYSIIKLHEYFGVNSDSKAFFDGIFIMIENEGNVACLFADELIGKNQVVVKPLPSYIKKIDGISGCTVLGDSKVSLILDAFELTSYNNY